MMSSPRISVEVKGDIKKLSLAEYENICDHARATVTSVGTWAKDALRAQVESAGLGVGVSKAWRMRVFPGPGVKTTHPAALIYSKAQKIHDAFNKGALIRAKNGSRFLAIPTENVPRSTRAHKVMRPVDVEAFYNRDLIFIKHSGVRPGGVLVLRDIIRSKDGSGWRKNTKRRVVKGRKVQDVVMFILIPQAQLQKKLDIEAVAKASKNEVIQKFARGFNVAR